MIRKDPNNNYDVFGKNEAIFAASFTDHLL